MEEVTSYIVSPVNHGYTKNSRFTAVLKPPPPVFLIATCWITYSSLIVTAFGWANHV
jgi:hypothetical protein